MSSIIRSMESVLQDLERIVPQTRLRSLRLSTKWASEMLFDLRKTTRTQTVALPSSDQTLTDDISLAQSYLEGNEYSRCVFVLENASTRLSHPLGTFLWSYALYLSGEKAKSQETAQMREANAATGGSDGSSPAGAASASATVPGAPGQESASLFVWNQNLEVISNELSSLDRRNQLDAFGLYVLAVVERESRHLPSSRSLFQRSIRLNPSFWSAWEDLAYTCTTSEELDALDLPDHWIREIFLIFANTHIQRTSNSLKLISSLSPPFQSTRFIRSLHAVVCYYIGDFDKSQSLFEELRRDDPFMINYMDMYSNILYVKEDAAALNMLAHDLERIQKFCPETCCTIGNYYGLKRNHEKAIFYFHRALLLNPKYTSAWTLMGHEYIELKLIPQAIDCYRHAVDISSTDYRAWYGLGQTYELMDMPHYALYYYKKASDLRPYDSRIWYAIAVCYEKAGKKQEAVKCYERAESNNDIEGRAALKLAQLYRELLQDDLAAIYYQRHVNRSDSTGLPDAELVEALLFLAKYYIAHSRMQKAEKCCERLLESEGPEHEEARGLLRDLRRMSTTEGAADERAEGGDQDSMERTDNSF